MVFTSGNMNANPISFLVIPKAGKDVPFDFTLSDVFMYEGAYTNPPLYVSPDVNPNMSILYKERLYEKQYGSFPSLTTSATRGWQRIYEIPHLKNTDGSLRRAFFRGVMQISKSYNSSWESYYEVRFAVAANQYTSPYPIYVSLEADVYALTSNLNDSSILFNKFRLSQDSNTKKIYLDGYHYAQNNNSVYFDLFDFTYFDIDKDQYLYRIMKDGDNTLLKQYLDICINELHYRETIPSTGITTLIEATPTFKMSIVG